MTTPSHHPARWWHRLEDGRLQCDLCPRDCRLHDGQRGFCFVRAREGEQLVLTTYGRSSGFCVDPIEKKPLNHFYPGTSALSFGTAGCNLGCRFCQNWDISKATEWDTLADQASPEAIAERAQALGCRSVAFTYNDPTIFAEYAIDVAVACRARGVKAVAVTAGYIHPAPLRKFAAVLDAANVDLKAFTEDFYRRITFAQLGPVLETLRYLVHEAKVWTEITTLLIPGHNDSEAEVAKLSEWVVAALGPRGAAALLGLPPGLQAARRARDAPGDAAASAAAGARGGPPARVHRQRARRGGRHHVLCGLPGAAHRARMVRAARLPPDGGRPLPRLWGGARGPLRRGAGAVGASAAAGAAARAPTSLRGQLGLHPQVARGQRLELGRVPVLHSRGGEALEVLHAVDVVGAGLRLPGGLLELEDAGAPARDVLEVDASLPVPGGGQAVALDRELEPLISGRRSDGGRHGEREAEGQGGAEHGPHCLHERSRCNPLQRGRFAPASTASAASAASRSPEKSSGLELSASSTPTTRPPASSSGRQASLRTAGSHS
jgi:AmmeMemoRadiSam system radical SAM enzyme